MFEEYLEDAYYFAGMAKEYPNAREAKRYYRASIFYAASAVEAFVSYVNNILIQGGLLQPYEIALLTDVKFTLDNGRFELTDRFELHSIEDKLKYLLCKTIPSYDFKTSAAWSKYIEFKDFINSIIHPIHDEDETTVDQYHQIVKKGLSSSIDLIDTLCNSILRKPLRQKIRDLVLTDS